MARNLRDITGRALQRRTHDAMVNLRNINKDIKLEKMNLWV
jgi:hypothetical protein